MAGKPEAPFGTDPITPGDPCIDADGSINVCAATTDDCSYRFALFTQNPTTAGAQPVCFPQLAQSSTGGSICAKLPAGTSPTADRWVTFSCEDDGSVYPRSGAFHFLATSCPDNGYSACMNCKKPVAARLGLELDTPVAAGTSTAHAAVNQPVFLTHSQDRSFPCCWFSPPLGDSHAGANPAYWMLQKTADDTWFLCLRRVSHELAAYHHQSKDSQRFPIIFKRGRVSKDFENWPDTITIKVAK